MKRMLIKHVCIHRHCLVAKGLVQLSEAMSRAMQDGQVIVECSEQTRPTAGRNGKPLQYFCYKNPMNSVRRQKDMTLKDKTPPTPGWKVSNMLLGKTRGQLLRAPERMKRLGKAQTTPSCGCLVGKVKSNAVKMQV